MQRILLLALSTLAFLPGHLTAQPGTVSVAAVLEHELTGTDAEGGGIGWAVTAGVLPSQAFLVEGGVRVWHYDCGVADKCQLAGIFARVRGEFALPPSGLAFGIGMRLGPVGFDNESGDPYWGAEFAPEVSLSQRVRRLRVELLVAPTLFGLGGIGGIESSVSVGVAARLVFGAQGAS